MIQLLQLITLWFGRWPHRSSVLLSFESHLEGFHELLRLDCGIFFSALVALPGPRAGS